MRRNTDFVYADEDLRKHWAALHAGDREPYPSAAHVARLARSAVPIGGALEEIGGAARVAEGLQKAWREFHAGEFAKAIESGRGLGAFGAVVANKAAAIHTLYLEKNERKRLDVLRAAMERGERAVEVLPECANAHYTLALVLGRYSQRISIVQAVTAGYGGRIRDELEHTLALEPKHAEAHVALGLYHAELVRTLGGLAARLTYGASEEAALRHFRRALELAPRSAIAHVEYAHGLLLLDPEAHRKQVEALCAQGAACKPLDMMEHLDVERARKDCTHA